MFSDFSILKQTSEGTNRVWIYRKILREIRWQWRLSLLRTMWVDDRNESSTCLGAHVTSSLWHTLLADPFTLLKKTHMTFLSPAHLRVRCPTWLLWQLVRVSLLLCLASLRECMSVCVSEPVGRTGSRIDPKAHLVWSDFLTAGWCGTVAQMLQRLQLPAVFVEGLWPFRKINTMGQFLAHTGPLWWIKPLPQRQNSLFFLFLDIR